MENQLNSGKLPFSLNQKVVACQEINLDNDLRSSKEIIENLRNENFQLKKENNFLKNLVNQHQNSLDLDGYNSQKSLYIAGEEPAEKLKKINEKLHKIQLFDEENRKLCKNQETNTELNINEILKQKESLERKYTEELERYKEEIFILKWQLQNSQSFNIFGKSIGSDVLGPESSEG
ncbi:unnamed protein product [Blepharisma stoltei]|uniref:Uncharacterized protein n=1 Tax=Blepharisma stoltei TaxID=1481888 RepID=A0AAU9JVK8_9CILI|nr:unnamed protein product [Blepharisma stoltei]